MTFCWVGVVVLLSNTFKIMIPLVIGRSITDLNHGVTKQAVLHLAIMLVGLSAASGIFLFLTRWIMIGISREIEFDLRNDLFRHLEKTIGVVLPGASHRRHYGAHDQ